MAWTKDGLRGIQLLVIDAPADRHAGSKLILGVVLEYRGDAPDPVSQLSTFTNGGSSRYQGVELQLLQDVGKTAAGDISAYFNYAHNQATFTASFNADFAGSVTAGQPLAGVPRNLISTGVVWKYRGWRANLDGRHIERTTSATRSCAASSRRRGWSPAAST